MRGTDASTESVKDLGEMLTVLLIFFICMLGLRTIFIMEDNDIKILFCCTFEMDKISCKHVNWSFEPHDVQNMI